MPVTIDTRGKDILRFAITSPVTAEGVLVPNATTIAVSVPFGTNLANMNFTATHTGASISPAPGTPLDFTSPRIVTVRAENGQEKLYTVTVNLSPPSAPGGGTAAWPSAATWQSYGFASGLTQPSGTTVGEANESESPSMLSVTLNNSSHAAYEDLLSRITALLGSPYTLTGASTTQTREAVFLSTVGANTLIVTLEMDASDDEITIVAIKY
jgi:hypothetical protein